MFTNQSILKRLMKDAYKHAGLSVGNNKDTIYIGSGYWELEILRDHLPRTILACIIELAGELPEEGEQYNATKDGNQMEIPRSVGIPSDVRKITTTSFLLKHGTIMQRMLQDEETGKIYLLNNVFTDMISDEYVDWENREEAVDGPLYNTLNGGVYWGNNIMTFHACFRMATDRTQSVLQRMEGIDLTGTEYRESFSEDPDNEK